MTKKKRPPEAAPSSTSVFTDPDLDDIGALEGGQEDVALLFGQGRTAFVPESIRRAVERSPELFHALDAIQGNVAHRQELLVQLDQLVGQARSAGASWVHIGWCLGITSEAARRRFS